MAELVVEADQRDVVAFEQARLLVHQYLGNDEERDALGAGIDRSVFAGDLGEHQMDDVLGQVVLGG